MEPSRKQYLIDRFPNLTCEEIIELKGELESERKMLERPVTRDQQKRQLALALLMMGVEFELVNRGECK